MQWVFLTLLVDSARRFLQYMVILYVDYEYNVCLFIGLRDLDRGAGSGVATHVGALLYGPSLQRGSREFSTA